MKNIFKSLRKGFTLVELLVVIGVLGVLAGGLVIAIDPQDKIRQGNDAKVQSDISQVGSAIAAFAANNEGDYPVAADCAAMNTALADELIVFPTAPSPTGYVYTCYGTVLGAKISGTLLSNKFSLTPNWCWSSGTGAAVAVAGSAGTTSITCP